MRVRVTIEFEQPQGTPLLECAGLVLHQMREMPRDLGPGSGHLNYICHDNTMRITAAVLVDGEKRA
jgi:hypothetical protein